MENARRCRACVALAWLLFGRFHVAASLRAPPAAQHGGEGAEAASAALNASELPTILVAVNVHELPEVAALQCADIDLRLRANFHPEVALSCNEAMHRNLSRMHLPRNVHVNPQVIEKRRFSGTLLQGIISNLRLLARRSSFSYALVLSSKSKIMSNITEEDIADAIEACGRYVRENCSDICHLSKCSSHMHGNQLNSGRWTIYRDTLLARYVRDAAAKRSPSAAAGGDPPGFLVGGNHEGLVLDATAVRRILEFLADHRDIEQDLYQTEEAVEEFALHTMAAFLGGGFGLMGGGHTNRNASDSFSKVTKVARTASSFEPPTPRPPKRKRNHNKGLRWLENGVHRLLTGEKS